MQCQFAQELFSDHLSDTLDRAQKVSLDNHLAVCPGCREQVAGLRDVWASLETLPVVEPPKFFHENIMDRIAIEAAKEQEAKQTQKSAGFDWRSLFRARSLAMGMAAVVLFLGLAEAVQTQRGSLGPITAVVQGVKSLFAKPAPPALPAPLSLQKAEAVWAPGEENGGGSLKVTLRANPLADSGRNEMNFTIMQAGNPVPLASGVVTSTADKAAAIPLPNPPAPDSLSVVLTDAGTSRTATQTLSLPAP